MYIAILIANVIVLGLFAYFCYWIVHTVESHTQEYQRNKTKDDF